MGRQLRDGAELEYDQPVVGRVPALRLLRLPLLPASVSRQDRIE